MGANLSTPSQNPSDSNPPILLNPVPKSAENQNPLPKTLKNQPQQISEEPTSPIEKGQDHNSSENTENIDEKAVKEGEEEEEGECGFCLFMKGGGCKDEFTAWEVCVDDVEKNKGNIVEKCYEVTQNLKKCMESNYEYYEPILRAEKAAEEQAKKELERVMEEKEKEKAANVGGEGVEEKVGIGAENEANVGSKGVEGRGEVGVENEENVGSKGVEESVDEIKVEKVKEAEG